VPVAGDLLVPRLDVDPAGPDTVAVLTVINPDDTRTPVPVRAESGNAVWFGDQLRLTGGQYRLWWTVTGTGADDTVQYVSVDPDPNAVPDGFSFATTADLVSWTGQPLPDNARRTLIAASREIERITRACRYRVDTDGRPLDPDLRRALAEATCELVGWWAETGTQTGARGLLTSASIGGVTVAYNGNSTNPQADRVGPAVWTILMSAGLLNPGTVFYG
jgi:hypothetical protein